MKQTGYNLSEFLIKNPIKEKILWDLYTHRYRTHARLKNDMRECKPKFFKYIIELKDAGLIDFIKRGSQSFYKIKSDQVIKRLESVWKAMGNPERKIPHIRTKPNGIKYCRSCYDHLAGYLGVGMINALEKEKYTIKTEKGYQITDSGWRWLKQIDIQASDFKKNATTPLTRQCLDNTEKKPHLAGQLGAMILKKLIEKDWLRRTSASRVLEPTEKGKKEFFQPLGVSL